MIRFADSCGDNAGNSTAAPLRYFSTSSISVSSSGRNGTKCYSVVPPLRILDTGFSGSTIIFHGAWAYVSANTRSIYSVFDTNGVIQATIEVTNLGAVKAYRGTSGGTLLGTSSVGVFTFNGTFFHIAAKIAVHASTGTVDVWIDGVNVLSLTGQNTASSYSGTILGFDISPGVWGGTLDDIVVCDGSGAAPDNDYLGDCRVETLMASTGNGSNVGLTPSTGSDHGALVDEVPPTDDTDYNSGSTAGVKDTYNFPSRSGTGTIIGVQACIYARKSDGALKQLCSVLRHGGIDYDGATKTVNVGYQYYLQMNRVNPGTGVAWTDADIAALEAGMKVVV